MKRWRRPPLQHPLAPAFAHAVESLCTALTAGSTRSYNMVVRNFLIYLGATHPAVTGLEQLRRDPHILGWIAYLRAQNPPLATTTCIGRFFALRTIFHELARTSQLAELAYLLLREDIPRSPHTLPRPLTAEQDQLLEQEFMHRNDLGAMSSSCSATAACVSANASISPMTVSAPRGQTNGRFMSPSAN